MQTQAISVKQLRESFPQVRQGLSKGLEYLLIYRSQPIAEIKPIGTNRNAEKFISRSPKPSQRTAYQHRHLFCRSNPPRKRLNFMRILPDLSIYISVLSSEDKFHQATKAFLEHLKSPKNEFIVPTLVMLEVGNVIQKMKPKTGIEKLYSIFENGIIVEIDETFTYKALPIFKNLNLKTSDAIIATVAKLWKATLFSWDKKLLKESTKIVPSFSPVTYKRHLESTV